ncbi:hypothetical protein HYQ44_000046 [Verticillium longisporum]|nr:hypothetical protein HYQ44_000046 [Verticillium longisporum]
MIRQVARNAPSETRSRVLRANRQAETGHTVGQSRGEIRRTTQIGVRYRPVTPPCIASQSCSLSLTPNHRTTCIAARQSRLSSCSILLRVPHLLDDQDSFAISALEASRMLMAYYHYGEESDRRPGRSRQAHPRPHVDWLETGETVHDSLPRRTRRGHIIQYADEPPSSMRRSQTSWSERSSPAQVATMPLRTRAATVTTMTMPVGRGVDHHRHQSHHHRASRHYEDEDEEDEDDDEDEDEDEDGDESPAGSRRNLRRGMSPRSVRHYRSTPESRKDSRPSQPDSDGESDTTVSTEDKRHQDLEKHGQLQRRARHPEPDDHLDRREEDRRWRRRRRRGTVVYDTQDEDPTPHQSALDHRSPIRHLSRHSSRRSSELVESGSSIRRGYHIRSQSLLEAPTPPRSSVSRPRRRRHSQVIYTEIHYVL